MKYPRATLGAFAYVFVAHLRDLVVQFNAITSESSFLCTTCEGHFSSTVAHKPLHYSHRHFIAQTVLFVIWATFRVLHTFPRILHETRFLLLCLWCLRQCMDQSFCLNHPLPNDIVFELGRGARIKWRRKRGWETEGQKWREDEIGDERGSTVAPRALVSLRPQEPEKSSKGTEN